MNRFRVTIVSLFLFLAGCSAPGSAGEIEKVGLLVPDTINDQVWGSKGYRGLLRVQETLGVDAFYKEDIDTEEEMKAAIKEFDRNGVNFIFGHGNEYAHFFNKISPDYPEMTFVSFNGNATGENVRSLNFEGNAMGFFGGMVAGGMTKSDKVGVIAAYEWQPEVGGFFEGASFINPSVDVDIQFVQSWNEEQVALDILNRMIDKGVDVFYPAGDGFNIPVIEKIKEEGLYAIGYVSDQSDLGRATVLTSTVQNIPELYEMVAVQANKGQLRPGNLSFDFQDGVITMGEFSPVVPPDLKEEVQQAVDHYRETGDLPNEVTE